MSTNSITGKVSQHESPVTPMQHGMLFHSLYEAGRGVDIEQIVCSLRGPVEIDALEKAWARVFEGCPQLRIAFRWKGVEHPVQVVTDQCELPIVVHDITSFDEHGQRSRIEAFLEEDRARGFDMELPPLTRVTLFRLGEESCEMIWTVHHAVLDGRSFPIVLRNVLAAHDSIRDGEQPVLEHLVDYHQFAEWMAERDSEADEAFWSALLGDVGAPTSIDGLASQPQATATDRGNLELSLSRDLTERLRAAATQAGVTMNTFVQASWALMLARHEQSEDVVFGAVRAGRKVPIPEVNSMVGTLINTLPVRARCESETKARDFLRQLREQSVAVRPYEHSSLIDIQSWSGVPTGTNLFHTVIVFDGSTLDDQVKDGQSSWNQHSFRLIEQTNFPLTLYGYDGSELGFKLSYDRPSFDEARASRILKRLEATLEGLVENLDSDLASIDSLPASERKELLSDWNDTECAFESDRLIHELFQEQVRKTPGQIALAFEEEEMVFAELDRRSNQLARWLQERGVGPGALVGVCIDRSIEMVVSMFGILKAGCAYVPMDPKYPAERLAYMQRDSGCKAVLTQQRHLGLLQADADSVLAIDQFRREIDERAGDPMDGKCSSDSLAYVIYTSGSTGNPKGVMVSHRNVLNFFTGMDAVIEHDSPGVWLSVTSISFDISVLEIFWTLARGFKVVLQSELRSGADRESLRATPQLSLSYFASSETSDADKYRLLMDGTRFADKNGFTAVWTPERHFHEFGGLFPNPSVTNAALAAITERIELRAGSVVLPLHHPIRVAEEWSTVDNLSGGRVGISFASGWHANDFVISPDTYESRHEVMYERIETVRRLWRGETVNLIDGAGAEVPVAIMPRPVQSELPVWVTAGGSLETFKRAGEIGANLLTHLLGQNLPDLGRKLDVYREAFERSQNPGRGHVTLMLHTFVGRNEEEVRELVRGPLLSYLKTSSGLVNRLVESVSGKGMDGPSEEEMELHWDRAFDRFYDRGGLLGSPEKCLRLLGDLAEIGVDEISCLIDFGVETDLVLESLECLAELLPKSPASGPSDDYSMSSQIRRHGVTHLQTTPSLMSLLLLEENATTTLGSLQQILVGGEAMPVSLAERLQEVAPGRVTNVYGPTETTIWSTSQKVEGDFALGVPIGVPLANTSTFVLGPAFDLLPVGVPGELCIGGFGVTAGYLERPDLTAERFIRSSFVEDDDRLYRTGDLVRRRDDGVLLFLGRLDHQVKLRGHRIELGEIEATLASHEDVEEAVVVAREDAPGDKKLVGYFLSSNALDSVELRNFLGSALPEFMVPSTFVRLPSFPLTPNGKVDRKALPAPAGIEAHDREHIAPRTPTEVELVRIWQDVLGIEKVSVSDSFFELGGHSLSAVQVSLRVQAEMGIELAIAQVFRAPRLDAMAEAIDELLLSEMSEADLDELLGELDEMTDEEARTLVDVDGRREDGRDG